MTDTVDNAGTEDTASVEDAGAGALVDIGKVVVAVDDGYAQQKSAMRAEDGTISKQLFRSSIRRGSDAVAKVDGDGRAGAYETEETDEYTISEVVETMDIADDSYHTSTHNRALVMHALVLRGLGGRGVDLVTGLPVRDYYLADGKINMAKVDPKRANLRKGIVSISDPGSPLPVVRNVSVGCQAVASYIDHVVDDALQYRMTDKGRLLAEGKYGIVDLGGRTLDIALVINEGRGPTIDMDKAVTENIGVLDVYAGFMDLARERFKFQRNGGYTLADQDRIVRSGKMRYFSADHDVSDLVKKAKRAVSQEVRRFVDRHLGTVMGSLEGVLFVGGGCAMFRDIADGYGNGIVPEDPEFSNAVGLLKQRELALKARASKTA